MSTQKLIEQICNIVEDKYDMHVLTDAQKQEIQNLIDSELKSVLQEIFKIMETGTKNRKEYKRWEKKIIDIIKKYN